MKLLRIQIRSWTASFRYPGFISGFQPSLPVPPLSTIYGLISAARGIYTTPSDTAAGYIFQSKGKAVDLETIYELDDTSLKAGMNVVRREILYEPELFLYLNNLEFEKDFKAPHYPLLLGRSSDLAFVSSVKVIDVDLKENTRIGGSIFPFKTKGLYGMLQALPSYFSEEIPRKARDTRPFYLVESDFSGARLSMRPIMSSEPYLFDDEMNWGIYLHYAKDIS
ncbi:MAG: type I-B CRISPR-associated protein Cas5 [Ignavibacteria bacterium]|jgi:CRISPR-associated protein Cas5t|nr:type I-B CRISPR-associated protein Cas5 [Ignavibacteria bacterium]MCU7504662.1 type I-B CRISPR-associated protein Cas5 [Ignavibacteria bacterium]MCU7517530.1 type I-B CRISPR-associated protein Cas5 [Ignavibacteria bacterium]